jgi:hypothetical protein
VILFSVGLPSRFTQWCDAVIARLAGCLGDVEVHACPPLLDMIGYAAAVPMLETLARVMIANRTRHLVIGVRQPDERLRLALAAKSARFVLALDDPSNAVAHLLTETGADPRAAVRAIANSCPMVMPFDGLPGALTMHADQVRPDPAKAVSAIAEHLRIAVEPEVVAAIVDEMTDPCAWPLAGGHADLEEQLPVGSRKMLEGALSAYRTYFWNRRLGQIVWTRDLFHLADDPGRGPTEPVEVAGDSRILTYGPYVHLPPGSWSAQVILGFSPETAGYTFLIDVYADGQLACATLQPGATRIQSVNLSFVVGEPTGKGVEIRVSVASAAAAGRVALGRVVLQPSEMQHPNAASGSEDFESVLEP